MGLGKTIQAIAFIAAIKGGKETNQRTLLSFWKQNISSQQQQQQQPFIINEELKILPSDKNRIDQKSELNSNSEDDFSYNSDEKRKSIEDEFFAKFNRNENPEIIELDNDNNDDLKPFFHPNNQQNTFVDVNQNINSKEQLVQTSSALTSLPVLIVCPASVLQHWHREFLRVC
jgi:hypothetical protein